MSLGWIKSGVTVVILSAAWIVSPIGAFSQSREDAGLPSVVSIPSDLEAVLRGYEEAWGNRDPVGLANLFTPDGFVLRPGRPPAHGREAILRAYANSGGPLFLKAYEWEAEGSVGFIIGGYSADPDRPEIGKFVLALRKGPSGAWLIVADIDNGN